MDTDILMRRKVGRVTRASRGKYILTETLTKQRTGSTPKPIKADENLSDRKTSEDQVTHRRTRSSVKLSSTCSDDDSPFGRGKRKRKKDKIYGISGEKPLPLISTCESVKKGNNKSKLQIDGANHSTEAQVVTAAFCIEVTEGATSKTASNCLQCIAGFLNSGDLLTHLLNGHEPCNKFTPSREASQNVCKWLAVERRKATSTPEAATTPVQEGMGNCAGKTDTKIPSITGRIKRKRLSPESMDGHEPCNMVTPSQEAPQTVCKWLSVERKKVSIPLEAASTPDQEGIGNSVNVSPGGKSDPGFPSIAGRIKRKRLSSESMGCIPTKVYRKEPVITNKGPKETEACEGKDQHLLGKTLMMDRSVSNRYIVQKAHFAHKCAICGLGFRKLQRLKRHVKIHHKEGVGIEYSVQPKKKEKAKNGELYIGQSCPIPEMEKSNTTKENTFLHLACMYCDNIFKDRKELSPHLQTHSPNSAFCPICQELFPTEVAMQLHLEKQHWCTKCEKSLVDLSSTQQYPVACKQCFLEGTKQEGNLPKTYLAKSLFCEPVRSNNGTRTRTAPGLVCLYCKSRYKDRESLLNHLKVHRKFGPICPVCQEAFASDSELQKHLYSKHRCAGCTKGVVDLMGGNTHPTHCIECSVEPANHTYTAQKKTLIGFTCVFCDKFFKDRTSLLPHLLAHKPNESFCPLCQMVLDGERAVMQHLETDHRCIAYGKHCGNLVTSMQHPLICKDCNLDAEVSKDFNLDPKLSKAYSSEMDINHEMDINQPAQNEKGILAEQEVSGLTCVYCSLAFKDRKSLQLHLKVHKPDGLFCPVCQNLCSTEDERDNHLETKHRCLDCGKRLVSFKSSKQLPLFCDECYLKQGGGKKSTPHVCSTCLSSFSDLPTLQDHLALHGHDVRKRKNHSLEMQKLDKGLEETGASGLKNTNTHILTPKESPSTVNQLGNNQIPKKQPVTGSPAREPNTTRNRSQVSPLSHDQAILSLNPKLRKFQSMKNTDMLVIATNNKMTKESASEKYKQSEYVQTENRESVPSNASNKTSQIKPGSGPEGKLCNGDGNPLKSDGGSEKYDKNLDTTSSNMIIEATTISQELYDSLGTSPNKVSDRSAAIEAKLKQVNSAKQVNIRRITEITSSGLHSCKQCTEKFPSLDLLNTHEKDHATAGNNTSICSACGHSFTSASDKLKHQWVGKYKHKCIVCSAISRTQCGLILHFKEHTCSICQWSYTSLNNYYTHSKGGYRTSYKCKICFLDLKTECSLHLHLKVHSQEKSTLENEDIIIVDDDKVDFCIPKNNGCIGEPNRESMNAMPLEVHSDAGESNSQNGNATKDCVVLDEGNGGKQPMKNIGSEKEKSSRHDQKASGFDIHLRVDLGTLEEEDKNSESNPEVPFNMSKEKEVDSPQGNPHVLQTEEEDVLIVDGPNIFSCEQCGLRLDSFSELKEHRSNHQQCYVCGQCGKEVPTLTQFKQHRLEHRQGMGNLIPPYKHLPSELKNKDQITSDIPSISGFKPDVQKNPKTKSDSERPSAERVKICTPQNEFKISDSEGVTGTQTSAQTLGTSPYPSIKVAQDNGKGRIPENGQAKKTRNTDIRMVRVYQCDECKIDFQAKKEFMKHMEIHGGNGYDDKQGDSTEYSVTRKGKVVKHSDAMKDNQPNVTNVAKNHMNVKEEGILKETSTAGNNNNKLPQYKCAQCAGEFKSMALFKIHRYLHTSQDWNKRPLDNQNAENLISSDEDKDKKGHIEPKEITVKVSPNIDRAGSKDEPTSEKENKDLKQVQTNAGTSEVIQECTVSSSQDQSVRRGCPLDPKAFGNAFYECEICQIDFNSLALFEKHILNHTKQSGDLITLLNDAD